MRTFGRILLLGAGLFLCINAGIVMYNIITHFNQIGWGAIFSSSTEIALFVSLIIAGVQILIGLPAVFSGIFNHCGFWTTIFALVLGALSVGYIIYMASQGAFNTGDWKAILQLILNIIIPIIYFLGSIFIRFKRKN